MFNKSKTTAFFAILTLVFSFTFPSSSFAKWKDKSDELPGLVSTEEILLIGAGTALVVFLIYKASKSDNKDKDELEPKSVVPDSSSTSGFYQQSDFSLATVQVLPNAEQELSVLPIVGLQRSPELAGYSSSKLDRVVLGVSIRF